MKKTNNAEMRALEEMRKVIDQLMNEDFETNRKPALMALKVSKVAKPEVEVAIDPSEEMSEDAPEVAVPDMAMETPGAMKAEMGKEVNPSDETETPMMSDEALEVTDEDEVEAPVVGAGDKDTDAVLKLKALLMKK